jgi:D-amino-acid dehydrogenase
MREKVKVIVVGSGIVGTASAWFLRQEGHEVTVVERQPGPALETTCANGCQISVSHSEPWANPSAPKKILKWLGRDDAPLLFRLRFEKLQWEWGLRFLLQCFPGRTAYNIRQCFAMADYSLRTLRALREEVPIEYDQSSRGIMHFYTDEEEFEASKPGALLMTSLGCPRDTIDADEVVRIEPALAPIRDKLVGGDYTPGDEHGDAKTFTEALAEKTQQKGAEFRFNTTAIRFLSEGKGSAAKITGLEVIGPNGEYETLKADAYVVSMGSFSAPFLKPLGINLMIYPAKGYSATYPIINEEAAPAVSLIDTEYKLVFAKLGNRLRVGGTAELNGYGRELNIPRCVALTRRTRELFPDACDYEQPNFWSGLRPMTPSNIPYIGKTKYSNLFLNTGHGTLGWTMGCGSGRAIAEIVSGRHPEINFNFAGTW